MFYFLPPKYGGENKKFFICFFTLGPSYFPNLNLVFVRIVIFCPVVNILKSTCMDSLGNYAHALVIKLCTYSTTGRRNGTLDHMQ